MTTGVKHARRNATRRLNCFASNLQNQSQVPNLIWIVNPIDYGSHNALTSVARGDSRQTREKQSVHDDALAAVTSRAKNAHANCDWQIIAERERRDWVIREWW
jgi:hypothetical protein